jgi:hypothetical protein
LCFVDGMQFQWGACALIVEKKALPGILARLPFPLNTASFFLVGEDVSLPFQNGT